MNQPVVAVAPALFLGLALLAPEPAVPVIALVIVVALLVPLPQLAVSATLLPVLAFQADYRF